MSKTYCINANSLAVGEFSGGFVGIRELAVLDGLLYGITTTGLVEFSGDDDLGEAIVPFLISGKLAPAGNQEYNVPKCSILAKGAGTLSVTTYTEERGETFTNGPYTKSLTSYLDRHELPLETRQLAMEYKFKIQVTAPDSGTNVGARISLFDIYVNPARHRRG